FGLRDGELRERGIRVDERLARDSRVLVTPEPRSARQVEEEIGSRAVAAHVVCASTVIGAVVVHEGPPIAEAERLERAMDIGGAVARIGRARVLDWIVYALAGVLDVEDLVPEGLQAEQVHQRAPRDAAEWVARDDPGQQDAHGLDRASAR